MKVLITSTLAVVFWVFSMGSVADPGKARFFQTSPVINPALEPMEQEIGAAWLRRSKDRVDGKVMTTVDFAGIPYTVWWIIFNNPAGCLTSPCGPDDVFNPSFGAEADVAVLYGSGAVGAMDGMGGGVINIDLAIIGGEAAGNGSQDSPAPDFVEFFGRALKKNNSRCAEIHLDIQKHVDLGDPIDWVTELTYPADNLQAFAIFPPAPGCK